MFLWGVNPKAQPPTDDAQSASSTGQDDRLGKPADAHRQPHGHGFANHGFMGYTNEFLALVRIMFRSLKDNLVAHSVLGYQTDSSNLSDPEPSIRTFSIVGERLP